jgi:hypothetical protein
MPVGAAFQPGNSNTYIKDHAATGYLITQYSRNPKDFPLARYAQYREVKKDSGYYLRMTAEQAGRLIGGSLDEFVWPDGADRPSHNDGLETIAWADYRTQRYDFSFRLGQKSVEQSGYDIKAVEAANHAQQAMTARTRQMHLALETNGNYDTGHRVDVTTISGVSGRWDLSTTARMDIKKSINFARDLILKDTLGVVKNKADLRLVMNPFTARKIGECQEMVDAIKHSTDALKHWKGDLPDYSEFGLPTLLYGIPIVVEDTVMVTSRRGASSPTRSYVCADNVVYLLSRPGGLMAKANSGPSFSSAMVFLYEDMTVETMNDPKNRRIDGHVVNDQFCGLVAPASCFKFENVTA